MLSLIALVGVGSPWVAANEPDPPDALETVLVQFAVDPSHFTTLEQFHQRIDAIVSEAMAGSDPDLIIFPEYTSVFALFSDFINSQGEVLVNEVSHDVIPRVDSDVSQFVPNKAHRFVRRHAERFAEEIIEMWSAVAAEHGVWILAGSGFVPAADEGVYNRVWVFDRSGEIVYHQDKVFLTVFEREKLGVIPGSVSDAETFEVDGIELAVTICRDSYFEDWERGFNDADAWIDIRANGEEYSPAVRRRFDTALPERIARSDVPLGLSTSLNGRFLDYLWQGPAFVVDDDGKRVAQSPTIDGDYLMRVEVPAATVHGENSVD